MTSAAFSLFLGSRIMSERERLDWLTVCVHDKSMLTFYLLLPVLEAVCSIIIIFL